MPGYDISLRHQGYLFVTDDETHDPRPEGRRGQAPQPGRDRLRVPGPRRAAGSLSLPIRTASSGPPFVSGTAGSRPTRRPRALPRAARRPFLVSTKATGIRQDAQGVSAVETTRGTIATRTVVNAAGPFAGVVGRMAGARPAAGAGAPPEGVRLAQAADSPGRAADHRPGARMSTGGPRPAAPTSPGSIPTNRSASPPRSCPPTGISPPSSWTS